MRSRGRLAGGAASECGVRTRAGFTTAGGKRRGDRRSLTGSGLDVERPVEQQNALVHAYQAETVALGRGVKPVAVVTDGHAHGALILDNLHDFALGATVEIIEDQGRSEEHTSEL